MDEFDILNLYKNIENDFNKYITKIYILFIL